MNSEENIKNQGFKVNDRRRFAPDGSSVMPEGSEEAPSQELPRGTSPSESSESLLAASFSSLIFSIASGAQSALGIAPHPLSGKIEKSLPQAQYSIDLLGVLAEKTRGNLHEEEEKLLQALLYDLRLRFLEAKKEESGRSS